ncbi:MAG TPA: acyl-CoA desaturase [Polyangiaceae bacterium]|nr:acyl-CoA desaturase [Polyangiaceae bacterium]
MNTNDRLKLTVSSDRLAALQWWRVMAFNLIPLLGCVVAGLLALQYGVSSVDIGLFAAFYVLCCFGVELGFHRHFAHNAFGTTAAMRIAMAVLGSMAAQGPVTYWVSNHRRHHKYTDEPRDPHSPYVHGERQLGLVPGLWHAHVGWLFEREITDTTVFAKDLLPDRAIAWVNRYYLAWVVLGCALPAVIGGLAAWSWRGALTGFLWGGLVRTACAQHATFAVNSICHRFGGQPFDIGGQSRNNFVIALLTFGGGWHHNHHAFPSSAVNNHEWWQIDAGAWLVGALRAFGLAWDVKTPSREMIRIKKIGKSGKRSAWLKERNNG